MKKLYYLLITAVVIVSCSKQNAEQQASADELFQQNDSVLANADEASDSIVIKYAKGLKVEYRGDSIHVTISNPDPGAKHSKKETLTIARDESKKRFICTTALQLGNFEVLGLEDRIVGINSLRNLFSPKMKAQMKDGTTIKIGKEGNFDLETIIAAHPDYIFVSASKHGGFEALKECGIPLISHHGYKETSPLGQAEWIKLVGLLCGEPRRANAVFADIENKYCTLKNEVEGAINNEQLTINNKKSAKNNEKSAKNNGAKKAVTVISGRQIRDGWYIVGGKSYMAQLFKDAGADYIMKDNTESGGVTLDFEAVYAKGIHADFWQTDGTYDGDYTLSTLAQEDERYTTMDAFKNKKVLFCNLSQKPYRELAGVQPHFLLADFVKAFHPELLPKYTPRYYELLK